MLTALALDTFMLATAKLQQGNTVDYLALSALHALKDPPVGAVPPSGSQQDVSTYNFVIDRAAVVAAASLLGSGAAQASASQLRVRISSGSDDEGEGCGFGSDDSVKDKWCGFEGLSDVGAVIFGQYDPVNSKFIPAALGAVATVNAVRVRLQLQNPSESPLLLPMMRLILSSGHLMFESSAIAYRDGTGRYMLVSSGS
jgi:hypothetical protein